MTTHQNAPIRGPLIDKGGRVWDVRAPGLEASTLRPDNGPRTRETIAAAVAAGGGEVYVPIGTYKVGTTVTLATGIELSGSGHGSILKTADAANVAVLDIPANTTHVRVSHLVLDGNGANQASGALLSIGAGAHDLDFAGVVLRNWKDAATSIADGVRNVTFDGLPEVPAAMFGAVGDARRLAGGQIEAGSTFLYLEDGLLTTADVGATIVVAGAGVAAADLTTTIASFATGTGRATLAAAASTNVHNARVTVAGVVRASGLDTTSGSATITDPAGRFTAADDGKTLVVRQSATTQVKGTFTYVGATSGTLSTTATATVVGAVATLGTDGNAAITQALLASQALGLPVRLPRGKVLDTGQHTLWAGAALLGGAHGRPEGTRSLVQPFAKLSQNTELWLTFGQGTSVPADADLVDSGGTITAGGATYANAAYINKMRTDSQVDGCTFYYPLQLNANPPDTYGPTVALNAAHWGARITNCLFTNPYWGIFSVGHARPSVRSVGIDAAYRGLYLETCSDWAELDDIHQWGWWQATAASPWRIFKRNSATAFLIGRTDGLHGGSLVAIGFNKALDQTHPNLGYGHFDYLSFESVNVGASFNGGADPGWDCDYLEVVVNAPPAGATAAQDAAILGSPGGFVPLVCKAGDGSVYRVSLKSGYLEGANGSPYVVMIRGAASAGDGANAVRLFLGQITYRGSETPIGDADILVQELTGKAHSSELIFGGGHFMLPSQERHLWMDFDTPGPGRIVSLGNRYKKVSTLTTTLAGTISSGSHDLVLTTGEVPHVPLGEAVVTVVGAGVAAANLVTGLAASGGTEAWTDATHVRLATAASTSVVAAVVQLVTSHPLPLDVYNPHGHVGVIRRGMDGHRYTEVPWTPSALYGVGTHVGDMTATNATLTLTTGTIAASDVTRPVVVAGAGAGGAPLRTTIATRTDATHAVLADVAQTTVVGAALTFTSLPKRAYLPGLVSGDIVTARFSTTEQDYGYETRAWAETDYAVATIRNTSTVDLTPAAGTLRFEVMQRDA